MKEEPKGRRKGGLLVFGEGGGGTVRELP
jgi:hypothetical protein